MDRHWGPFSNLLQVNICHRHFNPGTSVGVGGTEAGNDTFDASFSARASPGTPPFAATVSCLLQFTRLRLFRHQSRCQLPIEYMPAEL